MNLGALSATLNAKGVAVLVAIAVVGIGGIGGAVAGVGPTGGLDLPFAQQEDPAPAPETAVHLGPSDATVRVGETATHDVVVANASGGVGALAAVVSVGDPSVATITDVSLRGNQSDEAAGVSIAADGSSANLTAAPTDAAGGGSVAVATVTVRGDAPGTTDLGLRVDGLGTDAGDAYDVTAATGAAIAVEPNPDPAAFRVSNLNASRDVTRGEPFNVSVSVTNDGDLEATRTVRYGVDVDGDGALDADETAASREVTLAGHDRETVAFGGVNVTGVDHGSHVHGVFTGNDSATGIVDVEGAAGSAPIPETAVLLRPSGEAGEPNGTGDPSDADVTVDAGDETTYDVVVANASGGVGAYDFRVESKDVTHATVTDVSAGGGASDATTAITVIEDGKAVNVTAAPTDTADNGSVAIATVTISGHAVGATDIGLRVDVLGTEAGTAYNVTGTSGASVTVESDYDGGSTSSDGSDGSGDDAADADEGFTRNEITRAKYSVDFADLGSETVGEVQAIYNRQPFAGNAVPADVETRDEISGDRYDAPFSELDRDAAIEVQNEYDAQFGPLPSDPAHSRDNISRAKYDADFADLDAERAWEVQAIYNRQPFPDDVAPGEIRTRDEITQDRYGIEFDYDDISRGTKIEIQNDYDAQFGDGENE
ncbi:autotransporter outer membrane beta-barrel domain-containing protein [Halorubrum depositum]|uniref:hypothetical protein n=1 Tax=Halorubrum depositum TaxID=2583992 RepID=UPI0011A2C790|nr:hypothetical protein [Halorubrum depositum]